MKTSRDTLFVHPLPAHLAKHVTSSEDAIPHLVYRRSLKEDDVLLKNDVLHLDEEGNSFFVNLNILFFYFYGLGNLWIQPTYLS